MGSRRSCGTRSPEIAEQAAFHGDGFFANHIFWPKEHFIRLVKHYRNRFADHGHGRPEQAIVGLAVRRTSLRSPRTRSASSAPTSTTPPCTGTARRWRSFADQTPLSVGSPQEVIDKTLTFHEHCGDDQRQLFLIDHAGLPLGTVLDPLELLGEFVVPVLRKELDALRPPHVPDGPTHTRRVADRAVAA